MNRTLTICLFSLAILMLGLSPLAMAQPTDPGDELPPPDDTLPPAADDDETLPPADDTMPPADDEEMMPPADDTTVPPRDSDIGRPDPKDEVPPPPPLSIPSGMRRTLTPARELPERVTPEAPILRGDGGIVQPDETPAEIWFNESWMNGPTAYAVNQRFYNIFGIAGPEVAQPLPQGFLGLGIAYNMAMADDGEGVDAMYGEWVLSGAFGIIENLEGRLSLGFGGWNGDILIQGWEPNSEGGMGLIDALLEGKYLVMTGDFDVAVLGTIKLPIGSTDDLLGSGNFDLGLHGLLAYPVMQENGEDVVTLTAIAGFTSAGPQTPPDEDLGQEHYKTLIINIGAGATWRINSDFAANLQLQYIDPAFTVGVGGKFFLGDMVPYASAVELGLIFGFPNTDASMFGLHLGYEVLFDTN